MVTAAPRLSIRLGACLLAASLLGSCGGGGGDEDPKITGVSGNVAGLNGTLVLAAEGDESDSIAITASGPFQFTEQFDLKESPVNVFVYRQPLGQTCTVSGNVGSGFNVSCLDNPYTVSGTISGFSGTMVLQLNLADDITVGNGSFSFPRPLPNGAAYVVTPRTGSLTTHTCIPANAVGTINGPITNVTVTCTPRSANGTIGGNVTGLTGTVVLLNNSNGETRTVTTNGGYTFAGPMTVGADYFISVQTQPVGQTCTVLNASGTVGGSSGAVTIACADGTQTRAISGVVSGLKSQLRLIVNVNNTVLEVNPSGTADVPYSFPVPVQAGRKYQIAVRNQPAGQTCLIPHNAGTVAAGTDTALSVVCVDNVTDSLVGTWMAFDGELALTFYPNGTYVAGVIDDETDCGPSRGNGVEMGVYRYNASTGGLSFISNVMDTNGAGCGVWRNGQSVINNGTVTKTGVAQGSVLVIKPSPTAAPVPFVPVPSVANRPVGAFALSGGPSFMVFTDDGQYLEANANNDVAGGAPAGVEYGCYTGGAADSGSLNVLTLPCDERVDTDGSAGLSGTAAAAVPYTAGAAQIVMPTAGIGGVRILPN